MTLSPDQGWRFLTWEMKPRPSEEEEIPHELRGLGDDGAARVARDQALSRRKIGQAADVDALRLEEEVEGEGHRLALDESLPREETIALTGIRRDEAVDGQLAILEGMHQLVHESGALLIRGKPVAHHHDLAKRIVVRRDLLLEEVEEEALQIVVGGQHAPRHHA